MIFPRVEPARIERALQAQNQPYVDDGTYNENYDPVVAQRRGDNPPGTPNTDCYGLRTEPFNECANFLQILQIDNTVTAYYALIVQHLTTSTDASKEFVEGITKSIYNQVVGLDKIGKAMLDSVFSQVGGSSKWENSEGDEIGPSQTEYYDPNLDLSVWSFRFYPGIAGSDINIIDYSLWNSFSNCVNNLALSIKDLVPFDITGEKYTQECSETKFTISFNSGVRPNSAKRSYVSIGWVDAVVQYGPDAVRRGRITEANENYLEEATFYDMCVNAPECIKFYRQGHPEDYESDVAYLTSEQLESLNLTDRNDTQRTKEMLTTALTQIETSISFAIREDYYSSSAEVFILFFILFNSLYLNPLLKFKLY